MSDTNDATAPLEPTQEAAPAEVAPPIAGAAAPHATVTTAPFGAQPDAAYQPPPAQDQAHRDRVVAIVIAAVLGVLMLAGTFAFGVAVGSHLGRGRIAFGQRGAMMGQGYGYGQGLGNGQGYGYGYGGHGMRGRGLGRGQLPQGQQLPQNQRAPQGQTTPTTPSQ